MLFVFGKGRGGDGSQRASCQCRFEQIGCVTGSCRTTGTDQRMRLVDEQDDRLHRGLHFVNDRTESLFELALHAGPGLQQAHVERAEFDIPEAGGNITASDALGEAFDNGGFADAGFTNENRIVLAAAHEDIDHLTDFVIATDDGIHLATAGLFGEIDREFFEGFLLAHLSGGHRPAGFTGCSPATRLKTVCCPQ